MPLKKLIVASHHKSGTALSYKVFFEVAEKLGLTFWKRFYEPELYDARDLTAGWDVCFHPHSRIKDLLMIHSFVGWHCVRHPMALIYSAALFHQKCREPWVDVPLDKFDDNSFWALSNGETYNIVKDEAAPMAEKVRLINGHYEEKSRFYYPAFNYDFDFRGMTYRQHLQSMELEDKLIFEMNCFSRGVIYDMALFANDQRFTTVNLETLSFDSSMVQFRRVFEAWGIEGRLLDECLEIAAKHCLWNSNTSLDQFGGHATTGVSEQWKDAFQGRVLEEFRKLFGDAELMLGYEKHT